ncbi:MAG TPA: DUF4157 domain-containing protein [Kofleriaceae bacterium]|nr:DUF4157 domain-containing protein [Kofleriaceae bacterium]
MEKLYRDEIDADLDEPVEPHQVAPGRIAPTARIMRRAERTIGIPLPSHLRARFEQSLGADLSRVRIHTAAESAVAAKAIGARAYATGHDIHFGEGQYAPHDPFGVHLIAHEVAHTVQQAGGVHAKLEVSSPGDALEAEADRAADAMVAGVAAHVSGGPAIAARTPDAQPQAGTPGKVKVVVNITPAAGDPIEFDAKDYDELYQQVQARAQTDKEAGRCERGEIGVDDVTNGDAVVTITYNIPIKTSLPKWTNLAKQPAGDQKKFNDWVASVAAHEKQHFDLFKTGYETLKTSVIGPTRADCDKQFDEVEKAVKKSQDDFDNKSQPAPLPAPGGMIKVPPTPANP